MRTCTQISLWGYFIEVYKRKSAGEWPVGTKRKQGMPTTVTVHERSAAPGNHQFTRSADAKKGVAQAGNI